MRDRIWTSISNTLEIGAYAGIAFVIAANQRWLIYVLELANRARPYEAATQRVALVALALTVVWLASARRWQRLPLIAAGVLISLIVFEMHHGLRIADPGEFGWLLTGTDSRWSYLSWLFFRHDASSVSPGHISNLLPPVGTSVAHADAVPFFALTLKPFAASLPPEFQYFGAWFLSCQLLSGVFAALLIADLRVRWVYRLLSLTLLVWMSLFLSLRSPGAAAASWISLASLWLYFRPPEAVAPRRELGIWIGLAGLAAWSSPGVSLIVLTLAAATWARRWRPDAVTSFSGSTLRVALLCLVVAVFWLAAGYFDATHPSFDPPPGYASMDLAAPFDSKGAGFLPELSSWREEIADRHYLGAPIIVLLAWSLVSLLWRRPAAAKLAALLPLAAAGIVLTTAAAMPVIEFEGKELLDLSPVLAALPSASGGALFFWPVRLALVYLVLRLLGGRLPALAPVLLAFAITVQMLESERTTDRVRDGRWQREWRWKAPVDPQYWDEATAGRRTIKFYNFANWEDKVRMGLMVQAAGSGLGCGEGPPTSYGTHSEERLQTIASADHLLMPDDLVMVLPRDFGAIGENMFSCRPLWRAHGCTPLGSVLRSP